jgi:hypothetical protein
MTITKRPAWLTDRHRSARRLFRKLQSSEISMRIVAVSFALLVASLAVGPVFSQDSEYPYRSYLTSPAELRVIADKAEADLEPYVGAINEVIDWADREWDYEVEKEINCRSADNPRWIDDRGTGIIYANALAYHLTGEEKYAQQVVDVISDLMSTVTAIPDDIQQCRLNFGWGTPEYVAAAELIGEYWDNMTCEGPATTVYGDDRLEEGDCKRLFQNWLVKNPYYIVSYAASAQSNWGAAATNTTMYIADYLWDRPEITLIHRHPPGKLNGDNIALTPAQAYEYAKQLMLDRLNGLGVEFDSSSSCDYLSGKQQDDEFPPVKSQITENGVIAEDARREEHCNIPFYNGEYQNYPQIHINNTVQQCELMLRRGDPTCYDNISLDDIPEYTFIGPDGEEKVTHLYAGRGSIERAINAVIVDSGTEWRHDAALYVAYRYYLLNSRFGLVPAWYEELDRSGGCSQGVCFGQLTHGFARDESPTLPPVIAPPSDDQ